MNGKWPVAFLFSVILLIGGAPGVMAQDNNAGPAGPAGPPGADAILRVWETQEKDGEMQMFKCGDHYCGKMIYGKDLLEADGVTYKKDLHNPDTALRSRPLKDYTIITGLTYKDGKWVAGKIYYFVNGNSYDVDLEIKDSVLYMRAYMGIRMLGKTVKWNLVQ